MTVRRRESTRRDYYERMFRVLHHIHERLDEELTLADLAQVARFSPYHFHYIFRGIVGEALGGYIRRLRLELALRRLLDGRRPVSKIARDAGYGSHEAFDRAFKAHFGMTPSEARRVGERNTLPAASDGRLPEALAARLQRLLHPVDNGLGLDVEIRRIEPVRVAALRQVGPYDQIAALFGELMAWAGRHGLLRPSQRVLGLCHDDPDMTPPDRCRYDACIALDPDQSVPSGSDVGEILIQGGEYAVAVHRGLPCDLPQTYNTPVEELRTEVYVPLEAEA